MSTSMALGDVASSLARDEVPMLGINGMGGAGKTTNDFEVSCRSVSGSKKKLHEQVLSASLNKHDGKNLMKERMRGKKVLVLDDVGQIEQHEALGIKPKPFNRGSRIMVKARDEQVLKANSVGVIRDFQAKSVVDNMREVSKASMLALKKLQKRVLSNKKLRFSLGVMLMLMLMLIMVFIYYFYSVLSSSNSSEPKKEISSSESSEPKIMESTLTSFIPTKTFKYDVFLSFRGEDTRKNFVAHLYHALTQKGIKTYKDDVKIEKGVKINDQLFKSIEESRSFIIVFSKNYASSSWCLDELVKIMECKEMTEHTAYPVFFDVKPTEVRKQSGAVGEAFAKHENEEASWKWRDAMKEASSLAGWDVGATSNGDESIMIELLVDVIFENKISSILSKQSRWA